MGEVRERSKCEGCIDCGRSIVFCDYLHNHGRVRPVPGRKGGGCLLYAKTYDKQAELEQKHHWDHERALTLLRQGHEVKDIAKIVNANPNALTVFFAGREATEPDPTLQKKPEVWDRMDEYLELYHAGMNDNEAAAAMGVHPNTIGLQRRRLGLPRVPRKKNKENAQ